MAKKKKKKKLLLPVTAFLNSASIFPWYFLYFDNTLLNWFVVFMLWKGKGWKSKHILSHCTWRLYLLPLLSSPPVIKSVQCVSSEHEQMYKRIFEFVRLSTKLGWSTQSSECINWVSPIIIYLHQSFSLQVSLNFSDSICFKTKPTNMRTNLCIDSNWECPNKSYNYWIPVTWGYGHKQQPFFTA